VTANAKDGVSEAELFYKTVTALANNRIVPEAIWFKRLTLEQIYLGVNSGYLVPARCDPKNDITVTHSGEEVIKS